VPFLRKVLYPDFRADRRNLYKNRKSETKNTTDILRQCKSFSVLARPNGENDLIFLDFRRSKYTIEAIYRGFGRSRNQLRRLFLRSFMILRGINFGYVRDRLMTKKDVPGGPARVACKSKATLLVASLSKFIYLPAVIYSVFLPIELGDDMVLRRSTNYASRISWEHICSRGLC